MKGFVGTTGISIGEQVGSYDGGKRPCLISGFPPRRAWPLTFGKKMSRLLQIIAFAVSATCLAKEPSKNWHDGEARFFTREEFVKFEKSQGRDPSWLGDYDPKEIIQKKFLLLTGKPDYCRLMSVSIDSRTGRILRWDAGAKVSCGNCLVSDSIFTEKVRAGRSMCSVTLSIVNTYPDGTPSVLEFSGFKWKNTPGKKTDAQQADRGDGDKPAN